MMVSLETSLDHRCLLSHFYSTILIAYTTRRGRAFASLKILTDKALFYQNQCVVTITYRSMRLFRNCVQLEALLHVHTYIHY